jgi:transcriptional regulator with XRE-family HTH domain
MTEQNKAMANRLRRWRERRGESQPEFGKFLGGYNARTVLRWENGQTRIHPSVVKAMREDEKRGG